MICPKCQSESPEGNRFCGSCGMEFPAPAVPVPDDPGAYYCGKHKKVITRLRCGRCETPICPKCIVYTPAGTRCKNCSRHKIAIRPLGVLNEAGRVIDNVASSPYGGRRVWYLALWYFIMSFFRGL